MANDKYFYYWGPAIKPTREERTADDFAAAALPSLFELFCRAADAVWIPLHRRKLAVDIGDVQNRADEITIGAARAECHAWAYRRGVDTCSAPQRGARAI